MGVTAYTTVQVGPHSGDLSFSGLTPGAPRRGMGRGGAGLLGRPMEFLLSGVP